MKCDFCSDAPAIRTFDASDFVMENEVTREAGVRQVSTSGWAACAFCAPLVVRGDEESREALARHSAERLTAKHPEIRRTMGAGDVIAGIRGQHDRFFAHQRPGWVCVGCGLTFPEDLRPEGRGGGKEGTVGPLCGECQTR